MSATEVDADSQTLPVGALDHLAWVLSAGQAWATRVREQLRGEGRRAAGGWPGTLSEARGHAAAALRDQGLPPSDHTKLSLAIYAAAKKSWLERLEPLREEPDL